MGPYINCWATLLMRRLAPVILMVLASSAQAAPHVDACLAQLPKTLIAAIPTNFPGYRAPHETDNLPEDVKFNKAHGGKGCLGVAIADFDGDGKKDYLLGVTAVTSQSGLAVIALARTKGWQFHQIKSWTEDVRFRQYVAALKPGTHTRTESLDTPLAEGELESMRCRHSGALVGMTESTGIVYCYMNARWPYVWVSD